MLVNQATEPVKSSSSFIIRLLEEVSLTPSQYVDIYSLFYTLSALILTLMGVVFLSTSSTRNHAQRALIACAWFFLAAYYVSALFALRSHAFDLGLVSKTMTSYLSQGSLLLSNGLLLMGLWEIFHSSRFSRHRIFTIAAACFTVAGLSQPAFQMLAEDQRFYFKVGPQMLLTSICYLLAGMYFCPCLNKRFSRIREFKSSYFLNLPLITYGVINFLWFHVYLNAEGYFRWNTGIMLFLMQVVNLLVIGIGLLRVAMLIEKHQLFKVEELVRKNQAHGEMGQLSAGIVHDINNCVSVITMSAELAKVQVEKGAPSDSVAKKLDVIFDRAKTISATSREWLNSIRSRSNSVIHKYPIHPDESLEVLKPALQLITPANVELTLDLNAPPEKKVFCAPNEFEMMVMNLVKNSAEAIASRDSAVKDGSIRVRSEVITLEKDPGNPVTDYGDFFKLTIEDNGCGMTEEVLAHSLEMEFSTKGEEGSGFGLANVNSFVEDSMKGEFFIESKVDIGTTVQLLLPLYRPFVALVDPGESRLSAAAISSDWEVLEVELEGDSDHLLPESGGVLVITAGSGFQRELLMNRLFRESDPDRWSILEILPEDTMDASSGFSQWGGVHATLGIHHSRLELQSAIRKLLNLDWNEETENLPLRA